MMSDTNNQNSCSKKPCQSEQFERISTGSDEKNPDLSGRPVLYTGVLWIGVLRKFLIPRPVADNRRCCPRKARDMPEPEDVAHVTPTDTSSEGYIQQPPAHANQKPQELREQYQEQLKSKHSPLAALLYQIQEASTVLKDEVRQISDDLSELVQDGKTSTSEKLHTLRVEEAVAGRYSVISITSLLGYMAGVRRGVAVRLVYAATSAVAAATLCYPQEARHYNHLALSLFRQAVLLSVQLLRSGPQKTLAAKDSVEQEITSNLCDNENIIPETYSEPSQETEISSKANNDNHTNQGQSFSEFEYWQKQNPISSNSEYSTLQKNLSFLEDQEISSKVSQFTAHKGKLYRECQRDRTRATPYSPAPPVPPKILQPDNTHKAYQNIPNTTPNDSSGANLKEKSKFHSNSLHDSHSSLKVNTTHAEHKTSKPNHSNPMESNDVLSTLEPTKETVRDHSKNENRYDGQNYPLNKKLSRYYVEKKCETIILPEAEHDDYISKKGRKYNNLN